MASRRPRREESWDSLHGSDASGEAAEGGDEYSDEDMYGTGTGFDTGRASPRLLTISDVHRALHPLQATADRLGKQVEEFAETLDRLTNRKNQTRHFGCRNVLPVVEGYRRIAAQTVKQLRKCHACDHDRMTTTGWKRRLRTSNGRLNTVAIHVDDKDDMQSSITTEDLQRWEQEEQTWDLLSRMLQVEYPVSSSNDHGKSLQDNLVRPTKDSDACRYTPEKTLWNNYLADDALAWERHVVVEWLQRCAEASGDDIEAIVEQLQSGSDRGSGLWSHGWLYSKEAIKAQKRLRSWPQALDPQSPGIGTSLVSSDKAYALVTQLDPDATTRQARALEKQDVAFERTTWLACWEMLRRGRSWESIREWCQDRVEGWRAAVIHGDPRYITDERKEPKAGTTPVVDSQSRMLYRKICAAAAKSGGVDEYENAIYGVLGGYLPSVEKICKSWDDHLFAYYNSYLLRQFDRYLLRDHTHTAPFSLIQRKALMNVATEEGDRTASGNQTVERMKMLEVTKEEAQTPMKMLQGSLIAKSFDGFVATHGVVLARSANAQGKSKLLPEMGEGMLDGNVTAEITADDHDLLRMITHMIFIFQDLGTKFGDGDRLVALENIVVAYIDYLSKAGKQQLLPLYASRLSPSRQVECLGRQLPFITDHRDRQTVMRLMLSGGINVSSVLIRQIQLIVEDAPPNGNGGPIYPQLRILEAKSVDRREIWPIRNDFVGQTMTGDQEDLLNGFEWWMLLDDHWKATMAMGAIIYKYCLRTKGLAAGRKLSQSVTFSQISRQKTKTVLGRAEDLSISGEGSEDEGVGLPGRSTRLNWMGSYKARRSSSITRIQAERDILLSQSRTFRDFEALFQLLDAFEHWKKSVDLVMGGQSEPHEAKILKTELRRAQERVEITIQPLLHNWLRHPQFESEAAEFHQIRIACLPEVILAYISVLHVGGHLISREVFLKCMDLAATIAAEDSDLAACFVAAKRMPELVDALAISSKSIVKAEEVGASANKGRKKPHGETLDLWTIKPSNA